MFGWISGGLTHQILHTTPLWMAVLLAAGLFAAGLLRAARGNISSTRHQTVSDSNLFPLLVLASGYGAAAQINVRRNESPFAKATPGSVSLFNMRPNSPWTSAITDACEDPDPARSNHRITQLHYRLSQALAEALGPGAGPNFHTWAVWGSRKAGTTIRQEDLDPAIRNAVTVSALTGAAIGAAAGIFLQRRWLGGLTLPQAAAIGSLAGFAAGAPTGRQLAIHSRRRAASLILEGNRTVLADIAPVSARFLALLAAGASPAARRDFFAALRPGPTEAGGQEHLAIAFGHYLDAFDSPPPARRESMIAGNCHIVWHEHIRLEPYISGAMPLLIRRCATERLMTYDVGPLRLAVNAPLGPTPGVRDWTRLDHRLRYIFALFRGYHDAPELFAAP